MGAIPGSREPSQSALSRPIGFDPERIRDLAKRCESANAPDRELDALIHCAIKGWQFSHLGGEFFGTTPDGERFTVGLPERAVGDTSPTHHRMRTDSLAPRYTASLDAAMTLANGFGGQVTFFKDGTAKAYLWQPYPMAVEAKARGSALALTAAALLAIAMEAAKPGRPRSGLDPKGDSAGPKDIAQNKSGRPRR